MDNFLHQFLVMLAALAVVIALAWLTLRSLRGRLGGARGARGAASQEALQFVRALPLGPKERVVLMDHRGERWMLGVTAGGISLLARWPLPDEAAPPPLRATLAAADPD